jgi:hypothetical protein
MQTLLNLFYTDRMKQYHLLMLKGFMGKLACLMYVVNCSSTVSCTRPSFLVVASCVPLEAKRTILELVAGFGKIMAFLKQMSGTVFTKLQFLLNLRMDPIS